MVGKPWTTEIRSSSIRSKAPSGSNSACRTSVPPVSSVPMAIYEYLADERPARGEAGFGYAPFPEDWLAR